MSTFNKSVLAAAIALLAGSAQAAPTFSTGTNDIYFNSLENSWRLSTACTGSECLAFDAAMDPTGWQRANPLLPNNVKVGDVFAGILRVQNIDPLWDSAPGNRFTGYFAQEVASIDGTSFPNVVINWANPTDDPFDVLSAGEMYRMYTGAYNFTSATAGTTIGMVGSVTAQTFWASLGVDGTKDTYSYSNDDLSLPGTTSKVEYLTGLNLVTLGPSYNAGELNKVNDLNEGAHGVINPSFVCSAADILNPAISCSDFVGTAEIEFNKNSTVAGIGPSPWIYSGNDPLSISVVPEPGSLALLGLGLVGLVGLRARRLG